MLNTKVNTPWALMSLMFCKDKLFVTPEILTPTGLIEEIKAMDAKVAEDKILHPDIYHDGGWRIFPIRSANDGNVASRDGDFSWMDGFENYPELSRFLYSIANDFQRVRLMTLMPGFSVKWHYDFEEGFDSDVVRMHLVVSSNQRAYVQICHKKACFREGSFFVGDFGFPHMVINSGDSDRTHLVIDVKKSQIKDRDLANQFDAISKSNRTALKFTRASYKPYNLMYDLKRLLNVVDAKLKTHGYLGTLRLILRRLGSSNR